MIDLIESLSISELLLFSALAIADEILVIENGSIVYTAEANEVVKDHKKLYSFLGV